MTPRHHGLFTSALLILIACLVIQQQAEAFWIYLTGHHTMTRTALKPLTFAVGGESLKFTDKAVEQVVDGNVAVDEGAYSPKDHFDNETIPEGSQRLLDLKKSVETLAKAHNGPEARAKLGNALHTLQDFYAHSNWAELSEAGAVSGIETRLGRQVIDSSGSGGLPAAKPPIGTNPGDVVAANRGRDPEHFDTRVRKLSTGYYIATTFLPKGCGAPAGKVRHGTLTQTICEGVAKDPPGHASRGTAFSAALDATADFVKLIVSDLGDDKRAVRALLGINGTLGVVVDTTGSMSDDIAQVKEQIHTIIEGLRDTPDEPGQYLLEEFNDPGVGTPTTTSDPDAFLAAVDGLSAGGGGDCPELAMSGILQAVATADEGANLYVFTDADAKDGDLASSVISSATSKEIVINFALTGTCSGGAAAVAHRQQPRAHPLVLANIDPDYQNVATATGGLVLPVNRSDVGSIFDLVRPSLRGDLVTIGAKHGTLTVADSTADVPVPVDATLSTLIISASGPGADLVDPSGGHVSGTYPGATITVVASGLIFTITTPQVGLWHLRFTGTGNYSMQAGGNSALQVQRFQFVRPSNPDETHDGGLIPILGQPIAGVDATASALLSGDYRSPAFSLIDPDGQVLQTLDLRQHQPLADDDAFVGSSRLPAGPFRLLATGTDGAGNGFQRIYPALFHAETVSLDIAGGVTAPVPAGGSADFVFTVTNFGPAGTFDTQAVASIGGASVNVPSVALAAGESKPVTVTVHVPDDAVPGSSVTLTLKVTSEADASVTNSATRSLTVGNAVALAEVAVNRPTLTLGTTATGTVTFASPIPADGAVISLTSSHPDIVAVPGTLTVPGGSTTAQFPVTVTPLPILAPTLVTISASFADVQRQTSVNVVFPASTVNSEVTGRGRINAASTDGPVVLGSFTLQAGVQGNSRVRGSLNLVVPSLRVNVRSDALNALVVSGNRATLFGTLKGRGIRGTVPFQMDLTPGLPLTAECVLTYVQDGEPHRVGGLLVRTPTSIGDGIAIRTGLQNR